MLNLILSNLCNVGVAVALLIVAWLANFSLSLYYNITLLKENWDRKKFLFGAGKLLSVCIGIALLTVAITALPEFFARMGIELPAGAADTVNIIVLITMFAVTAYKYMTDAIETLKNILNYGGEEEDA